MVELARTALALTFDAAAAGYDASFTDSICGRALRQSVWLRLAPYLREGMDVLDFGCGTGEDAIWLARRGCSVLALDDSSAMLEVAAAKIDKAGLKDRVRLRPFDFNRSDTGLAQTFDFVLSNFGAVNCAKDLNGVGRILAGCVRPGGKAAIVFMGRFCLLETLYYMSRLDGAAVRRWRGKAAAKIGNCSIDIRYFTVGELTRAMPGFRSIGAYGVGVLLPPSYLFHLAHRRPKLFAALARGDKKAGSIWPFSRMGDHTLLLLERREQPS